MEKPLKDFLLQLRIPTSVIETVDTIVGKRQRSNFIRIAIDEKLGREKANEQGPKESKVARRRIEKGAGAEKRNASGTRRGYLDQVRA